MKNLLEKLIQIKEKELSELIKLQTSPKFIQILCLVETFKYTPLISDSLFELLGDKLSCKPKYLKDFYNLNKHNGHYMGSFYDKEDGI